MTAKESRVALVFGSLGHSATHLLILLYATVVLVLEGEFAMSYADLQWLSVPGFVLVGAGALPAGWLGDRWSQSKMMAVFFFGAGGAAIITGLAQSYVGLLIGLTLIGLFVSIYHPVGIAWLVKHSEKRGRALGVSGLFGSLGTAAAAIVAGTLAELVGWRAAFILPGIVVMAMGVWFVFYLRAGVIRDHDSVVEDHEPEPSTGEMKRAFVTLLMTVVCVGLIFQGTTVVLPKIFSERLLSGLPDSAMNAGFLVSLVYLFATGAQIIGGELADRLPIKWVYLGAQLLLLPVLVGAYFTHTYWLVVLAILLVSLNTGGQSAENMLVARYTPSAWRSRAFGVKFLVSLGVSSLGVALVPLVYDLYGSVGPIFLFFIGFGVVASISAVFIPNPAPADETDAVTPVPTPAE